MRTRQCVFVTWFYYLDEMADNPTEASSTGGARLKVRRQQQDGQDGGVERPQLHTERLVSNRPQETERKLSFPVRGFQTDQASSSSNRPEENISEAVEASAAANVEMNPIDEDENSSCSDDDDVDVVARQNNLPPVRIKAVKGVAEYPFIPVFLFAHKVKRNRNRSNKPLSLPLPLVLRVVHQNMGRNC